MIELFSYHRYCNESLSQSDDSEASSITVAPLDEVASTAKSSPASAIGELLGNLNNWALALVPVEKSNPPTIRTEPSFSKVAVPFTRSLSEVPAELQLSEIGS